MLFFYNENNIEISDKLFVNPEMYYKIISSSLNTSNLRQLQMDRKELLQKFKNDLIVLEEKKKQLIDISHKRFKIWTYGGLSFLIIQFIMFARLTWWEYSWDVIEPFTYFINVIETILAAYIFYLIQTEEFSHELGRNIYMKRKFKSLARSSNFDINSYEETKKKVKELEQVINLYKHDEIS